MQVEHEHVGIGQGDRGQAGVAVGGLADDLHARHLGQDGAHERAVVGGVVADENPRGARGIVPAPGHLGSCHTRLA